MIHENPGFVNWDLGHHVNLWHGDEEFSDLTPRMSSPHVDILNETEGSRASSRINTILRLISAINVLRGYNRLYLNGDLRLNNYGNDTYRCPRIDLNKDIEFEELINPFDNSVTEELEIKSEADPSPNRDKDYVRLAVNDSLVREVLLLLHLGEEDTLYFLVNTYKIFENIMDELDLGKSNGSILKRDSTPQISDELVNALEKMLSYTQYINSKKGAGLLARHGAGPTPAPRNIPTLQEVRTSLIRAINEWLNYKCSIAFGRSYRTR
ncbi:hypothetical protein [Peribacillus frigoritolerans]|jgi:hypothetical protein|uniref:hypothetical protein n=1 Tax=Peribacillus frigoritolerans TaxID=450367 RepID=UPI00203B8397|nr:hypothetical protein [Peribacillus frigoritolerans]MCM3169006.1 hypothetical protein [Peribacillus frigoritolerans]